MEQQRTETEEKLLYGNTCKFTLPSGYWVEIREQNGHDDDIISNEATSRDLTNMDIFLSSLILNTNLPFAKGGKLSREDIKKMLLRDKYAIIFKSRVHSMGAEISFEYDWGEGNIIRYKDDLSKFLWDYSKPFPKEDEEDYTHDLIKPYPENAYEEREFKLSSGKELKYHFLNGESEKQLLKMSLEDMTRNTEIRMRGLQQKMPDGKFQKVQNFLYFSKRDMSELHKHMSLSDPNFQGLTELENPKNGQKIKYPIIQSTDFFYPQEI